MDKDLKLKEGVKLACFSWQIDHRKEADVELEERIVNLAKEYHQQPVDLEGLCKEFSDKFYGRHIDTSAGDIFNWFAEHLTQQPSDAVIKDLKDVLAALEWMFDKMKVVDEDLQSDAFNIPANAIESLKRIIEPFNSKTTEG